jgi:purine-binding chemotaxis protein CheW
LAVREILRDPVIETVDHAPDSISGIVQLRGRAIPIVDLKRRLGDNTNAVKSDQKWVLIAQAGDMDLGFIADAVTRILRIESSAILPAPELIVSATASQYIRGVCASELGMLVALKLNRILSGDEIKVLKKMDMH